MLSRLIKKEILEHLMSLRFAVTCVLCLIVILCSLFVRCKDYKQVLDDHRHDALMQKNRLDTMDAPWRFPRRGLIVHRAPNPLKIFVRGVDDAYGAAVRVNAIERF